MTDRKELLLWKAKHLQRRAEWLTKKAENSPNKEILLNRAKICYKESEEYKKAAEEVKEQ